MKYSNLNKRSTIGVTSKCTMYERNQFDTLCKKNGITMLKGIYLLIRQAIKLGRIPMECDYENPDNLMAVAIPKDAIIYDIVSFIRMVEQGTITSEDGAGCMSDGKYMYFDIVVDLEWLLDYAPYYKYVCWFNK